MKDFSRDEKPEVRPQVPFYSRANLLQPWDKRAFARNFFFFRNRPKSRGTQIEKIVYEMVLGEEV